jgi:hypothetical protein
MRARLSTAETISHYLSDDLFTEAEAKGLLRRGFSADSKPDTDTKPVLDFLGSIQTGLPPDRPNLKFGRATDGEQDASAWAEDRGYTAFSASPRGLAGWDGSGQKFKTLGLVRGKPELAVSGTAKQDYKLTFTLAAQNVSLDIQKGSTAKQTSAAIAAAINAASDAIARSDNGDAFGKWTDSALGGVKATAQGASVFVVPDIHD